MFDMMRHCKAVGRRALYTFNLTPKSRKGDEQMNATEKTKAKMNEAINEFIRVNQRAIIEGVLDILEKKAEMYNKLLSNGHEIWIHSTDKRWDMIYQQRNKLWSKIHLINRLEDEIIQYYY